MYVKVGERGLIRHPLVLLFRQSERSVRMFHQARCIADRQQVRGVVVLLPRHHRVVFPALDRLKLHGPVDVGV